MKKLIPFLLTITIIFVILYSYNEYKTYNQRIFENNIECNSLFFSYLKWQGKAIKYSKSLNTCLYLWLNDSTSDYGYFIVDLFWSGTILKCKKWNEVESTKCLDKFRDL